MERHLNMYQTQAQEQHEFAYVSYETSAMSRQSSGNILPMGILQPEFNPYQTQQKKELATNMRRNTNTTKT